MGQQMIHILDRAFQGTDVDLDEASSRRLSGTVIWDGFEDQEQGDRQDLVRNALKEALGAEVQQVGILLTYTPREMMLMQAA